INPAEAETIREIFRLYTQGCDHRGPLGVKAIAMHLNARGQRNRSGGRFSHKFIHDALTREAYTGRHWFNRVDSRTRKAKPRVEWVAISFPAIIDEITYARVRDALADRNPKKTPPRIASSPTLLTGLAQC